MGKTILNSSEALAFRLGVKESLLKTYSGPAGMGILSAAFVYLLLTSTLVVSWPLCIALISGGCVFGGTVIVKHFEKYRSLKAQKSFSTPKDRLAAYISLIVFQPLFVLSAMSSDQSSLEKIIDRMLAWGYSEDYARDIMGKLEDGFFHVWSMLAYMHGLQLYAVFSNKVKKYWKNNININDFMTDTFWKNCQDELDEHFLVISQKSDLAKEYYTVLSNAISKRKITKEMIESMKYMGDKGKNLSNKKETMTTSRQKRGVTQK